MYCTGLLLWTLNFLLHYALSQEQTGPICYSCERSENPEYCRESVTCSPDEVCSVQQVFAPHGDIYFWSGCENYEVCEYLSEAVVDTSAIVGRRQVSVDSARCAYCCADDLCNKNCSSFINLALYKPAYQSSVSFNGTPDLAVDGDTTKNYFEGSCTHTAGEDNPWWAVDLQNEYHITKVRIHERDDAGADGRTFHLQVLVSNFNATKLDKDSNLFTLCGSYYGHSSEGNTITIDCPQNTTGRWIRIQQAYTTYEHLHLCEVDVFGF